MSNEDGSGDGSPAAPTPGGCADRPDLPGLLRGELRVHEVHAARDHLAGCGRCREELLDQAVGHSLLAGAGHTLREATPVPLPQPPARPAPPVRALDRRRRRLAVAGAAAAAVLVAGGVAVGSWTVVDPGPTGSGDGPAASGPQADLRAVGPLPGRGRVTMSAAGTGDGTEDGTGGRTDGRDRTAEMTVETHALPRPQPGSYYYAWLLDPRTDKMLPLGQVQAEGSATFRLPLTLLGRYTAIDISLETDDGDPGHSPTSVLRARYTPPTTATS